MALGSPGAAIAAPCPVAVLADTPSSMESNVRYDREAQVTATIGHLAQVHLARRRRQHCRVQRNWPLRA